MITREKIIFLLRYLENLKKDWFSIEYSKMYWNQIILYINSEEYTLFILDNILYIEEIEYNSLFTKELKKIISLDNRLLQNLWKEIKLLKN